MRPLRPSAVHIVACALLLAFSSTPAAFAAGGRNTGGGSGGGGANADPTTPGCASITPINQSTGYFLTYPAVWEAFTINAHCGGNTVGSWVMSFQNVSTGATDDYVMGVYNGNTSTAEMVDDDYAPPSTTYLVTLKETDPEGVQTERTETVETPPAKAS